MRNGRRNPHCHFWWNTSFSLRCDGKCGSEGGLNHFIEDSNRWHAQHNSQYQRCF